MKVHSGEKSNNVKCNVCRVRPPTSYGALYVASLVHVYGGPLGLWVKVIQFTGENKHGVKIKHLPYFLLERALFKDHEGEKRGDT